MRSTEVAKMKLPCLITVEKDIYTPRLPSYRLKAATKDRKVEMITFADFFASSPLSTIPENIDLR